MYRATKNVFAVMNVMGHKAVSTTMKYRNMQARPKPLAAVAPPGRFSWTIQAVFTDPNS
jgi:hypothetical protein